jgi:DNA-binding NarL/FixJ family response regulator
VTAGEAAGHEVLRVEVCLEGRMPSCLTSAESEVARLLLMGLSDREIARRRGTSTRTVANQLQSIYVKLGRSSRGELIAYLAHHLVNG